MKWLTLLFFTLITMPALGQFSGWSFNLSVNAPYIPAKTKYATVTTIPITSGYGSVTLDQGYREYYQSLPGVNAGFRFDIRASGRFFISSGLALSYLRFYAKNEVLVNDTEYIDLGDFHGGLNPGSPYGVIHTGTVVRDPNTGALILPTTYPLFPPDDRVGKTNVCYLQMPILIGTSLLNNKKLIVRGGIIFSGILLGQSYERIMTLRYPLTGGYFYSGYDVEVTNQTVTERFSQISAGGLLAVGYKVGRRLQIELSGQPNLTPMYKEGLGARATTFAFGTSYVFK